MSFPLNSNQAYIKDTGERSTLGKEMNGGSSLPTYSSEDAGKVLTVGEDGSLEWDEKGGAGGVYVGTDAPTSDIGSDGDYYYKRTAKAYGISAFSGLTGSGTSAYGSVFKAAKNLTIKGIRARCTEDKAGTLSIGDETTASETSGSLTFNAGEWTEYMLATPYQVSAGDEFFVRCAINSTYGRIAYASSITYDTDIATFEGSYYGSNYPGTADTANPLVDFIVEGDIYLVDAQYYKNSNTWSQIG